MSIHKYDDTEITLKREKKKKRITATRNSTNNIELDRTTITRKQKLEENKCTDISNDKMSKSYKRRPGYG